MLDRWPRKKNVWAPRPTCPTLSQRWGAKKALCHAALPYLSYLPHLFASRVRARARVVTACEDSHGVQRQLPLSRHKTRERFFIFFKKGRAGRTGGANTDGLLISTRPTSFFKVGQVGQRKCCPWAGFDLCICCERTVHHVWTTALPSRAGKINASTGPPGKDLMTEQDWKDAANMK